MIEVAPSVIFSDDSSITIVALEYELFVVVGKSRRGDRQAISFALDLASVSATSTI